MNGEVVDTILSSLDNEEFADDERIVLENATNGKLPRGYRFSDDDTIKSKNSTFKFSEHSENLIDELLEYFLGTGGREKKSDLKWSDMKSPNSRKNILNNYVCRIITDYEFPPESIFDIKRIITCCIDLKIFTAVDIVMVRGQIDRIKGFNVSEDGAYVSKSYLNSYKAKKNTSKAKVEYTLGSDLWSKYLNIKPAKVSSESVVSETTMG